MATGNYRIRIKEGDVEIEVEGDKAFVLQKFQDAQSLLKKPIRIHTVDEMPESGPAIKKAAVRKKQARPVKAKVEEPAKVVERKKPGRKPKAKVEEPAKVVERKKPGRKPKAKAEPTPKPAKPVWTDLKDKKLAEILDLKKPKRDGDRIVVVGYYINKIQKKREFRSNDILDLLKEQGMPEIKNVTYHLRKLSDDKGLLTHGRKQGRYKVSDRGVKWIEYI